MKKITNNLLSSPPLDKQEGVCYCGINFILGEYKTFHKDPQA